MSERTKAQWILAMSTPIDLAEAGKRRDWLADEILSALSTARQETREQTIEECAKLCGKQGSNEGRVLASAIRKLSPPPPKHETECKHRWVEDKVCSTMLICKRCCALAAPKRETEEKMQ